MTLKFTKASFITSCLLSKDLPTLKNPQGSILPEIVFVGKSNVGKSSLINHLLRQKKLAKVSGRPGKTQTLNFFNIENKLCLVDLPGYGFAKVPKAVKEAWAKSLDIYMQTRNEIKLVLLLLDCRRLPSQEDLEFLLWADAYEKPLIVILTKFDKLRPKERKPQKVKILKFLHESTGLENITSLTYSIKNSHTRQVLINEIEKHLHPYI
ncbi:MAG: putative GTP-binding protein EngB [Chlamydiia bacterium]|nr:putative GTP-binding protein EngB [Chlamydiia bacterium]